MKEKKTLPKLVSGNDGVIKVNMFLPDYEPQEITIKINNLKGRTTHQKRNINSVASAIVSGLTNKYGKL